MKKIESLEHEIRGIDLEMSSKQIEYNELQDLYNRKLHILKELDTAMELWLSYSE
ncbi:hypothetical protein [Bacillus sp. BHET2]|uniref:hypothetical protein n=1 Tax=Bacillus sp. BHET2 TaxID=2583818 RepID=UPI001F117C52|nr:hypothetical protein [Bacillus sp. BHET2]